MAQTQGRPVWAGSAKAASIDAGPEWKIDSIAPCLMVYTGTVASVRGPLVEALPRAEAARDLSSASFWRPLLLRPWLRALSRRRRGSATTAHLLDF